MEKKDLEILISRDDEMVSGWVEEATRWSFSRRKIITSALKGAAGGIALTAFGCKTSQGGGYGKVQEASGDGARNVEIEYKELLPSGDLEARVIMVTGTSLWYDYDKIILQADELKVSDAPDLTAGKFKVQVIRHSSAAASLIKYYLDNQPYQRLFPELFARAKHPTDPRLIFIPNFGPILAFRHIDVIDILSRPDKFTVDPYSLIMRSSTSGDPRNGAKQPPNLIAMIPEEEKADYVPDWSPSKGKDSTPDGKESYYSHYMLGTDQADLYIPDSKIARHVVNRSDIDMLRPLIRGICERLVAGLKPGAEFDLIDGGIARFAPVFVVMEYIGLPCFEKGKPGEGMWAISQGDKVLKGGDTFAVPESLKARYRFRKDHPLGKGKPGIVPTPEKLHEWVTNNFRNTFNNFEKKTQFQFSGEEAMEFLLAWSAFVIDFYKGKVLNGGVAGKDFPDTMITRLIRLQLDAKTKPDEYAKKFGCTKEDLAVRLGDDRIHVNAFGAYVGAITNPEEANGRIIEAMLQLKRGEIKAISGSYAEAQAAAKADDTETLNRYAIELLRLNPQGEVLLRKCVLTGNDKGTKLRSGAGIPKNSTIFTAYAAAMRDPDRIENPDMFDVNRKNEVKEHKFGGKPGTPAEYTTEMRLADSDDPQSLVYLHHGFGRHKCLGRYASEMTMEEVLRAVLRLGDLEGIDDKMVMDDEGLYPLNFRLRINA